MDATVWRSDPLSTHQHPMRILPVLDLQDGLVVRGRAGCRQEYRPIVSRLTSSARPGDVAQAILWHFGLSEFYLADLNAISGAVPAMAVYALLRNLGCRLWVDAGIQAAAQALLLAEAGVERIIVGLETIQGPGELQELIRILGPARVVFSLDLRAGVPLGNRTAWVGPDAWSIATQALNLGITSLIVLDLARVGTGQGVGTEALCVRLTSAFPSVEIIAGGGIRDIGDVRRLERGGIKAVLVASALHDGRLSPEDLKGY